MAERKCPVFALFTGNFELKMAVEQQRLCARILEHLFLICQVVTSEPFASGVVASGGCPKDTDCGMDLFLCTGG